MNRHIEAMNYIRELLNCCELNMDDMEAETVALIEEIHDWFDRALMPVGN